MESVVHESCFRNGHQSRRMHSVVRQIELFQRGVGQESIGHCYATVCGEPVPRHVEDFQGDVHLQQEQSWSGTGRVEESACFAQNFVVKSELKQVL